MPADKARRALFISQKKKKKKSTSSACFSSRTVKFVTLPSILSRLHRWERPRTTTNDAECWRELGGRHRMPRPFPNRGAAVSLSRRAVGSRLQRFPVRSRRIVPSNCQGEGKLGGRTRPVRRPRPGAVPREGRALASAGLRTHKPIVERPFPGRSVPFNVSNLPGDGSLVQMYDAPILLRGIFKGCLDCSA